MNSMDMMDHKVSNKSILMWKILGVFIICTIVLIGLSKRNIIYILGDEFGYWTGAAYFAGFDWSSFASINGYFSFGYGIILAPLFLIHNSFIMYKVAIFYNAIFLSLSFLIGNYTISKILHVKNQNLLLFISFVATVYPTNIAYSQTNMPENLLFLLVWVILYLLIKMKEMKTVITSILLGICLGYIYCVHMRALAIVIAAIIYLIYLLYVKEIKINHFLITIFALFFVLGTANFIKTNLIDTIYFNNSLTGSNDYSGQTSKILAIFTKKGIILFLESFIGKVFYLGSSTYLIFYWFLYASLQYIRKNIIGSKNKKVNRDMDIYIFLTISLLLAIGISTIFMLGSTRIDTLLYGRYNEYILGPIFVIGLYTILDNFNIKIFLKFWVLQIILSLGLNHIVVERSLSVVSYFNIIGIYRYMLESGTEKLISNFIYAVVIKSSIVYFFLFALVHFSIKRKVYFKYLVGAILCATWIYAIKGTYIYNSLFTYTLPQYEYKEVVSAIIEAEKDNVSVYYVYMKDEDFIVTGLWGGRLQFILPESKISVIDCDDIKNIEVNNSIFIAKKGSIAMKYLSENFQEVVNCDDMVIYSYDILND